jgi:predicted glycogen debranching enzyme
MASITPPTQLGWHRDVDPPEAMVTREWLVTNGFGGYASGTIGGACTRRFHGILIAALPSPHGRTMMFNHLEECVTIDGHERHLSADEHAHGRAIRYPDDDFFEEFVLEEGLPVWRWAKDGIRLEKRLVMPHLQNTTYLVYQLLDGPGNVTLTLRPAMHFRPHEGLVTRTDHPRWKVSRGEDGIEIHENPDFPPLRLQLLGRNAQLHSDEREIEHVLYSIEKSRGYDNEGPLWSPGTITIDLARGETAGFIASTERWEIAKALSVEEAFDAERSRRNRLLLIAGDVGRDNFSGQLVLASDQFLIHPSTRFADEARAHAAGESPRTVIAGYHWFTDWGRDTMISLEGLTLVTGRNREAGRILRTFATYVRNGLIPNMFPEGKQGGLYHTADATMWFFHALYKYVKSTGDHDTLRAVLPRLLDIIDHHLKGTDFNIHVDHSDGLLSQGAEGYQLTWMDAKVDGWVVTPRRGKAVEINALFYNALRILEQFLREENRAGDAAKYADLASRVRESFNARFWYAEGEYLYDVVDPNDSSLRPNQIFSLSLDFPVLDEKHWKRVVEVTKEKLLTPFGLRSLAPGSKDYKPTYDGDLRSRDAAYHQGTVWAWLIGPFIDAWLRVHPNDTESALQFLDPFRAHLGDACIGTISEVFDAEAPYHPRGCAAQAWSVAEVVRCLAMLRGEKR